MASLVRVANTLTTPLLAAGQELLKGGESYLESGIDALRIAAAYAMEPRHEKEAVKAWRNCLETIANPQERVRQALQATTYSIRDSRLRRVAHQAARANLKNVPAADRQHAKTILNAFTPTS